MIFDQKIEDVFSIAQQSVDVQAIPGAALGIITRNGERARTGTLQLDEALAAQFIGA